MHDFKHKQDGATFEINNKCLICSGEEEGGCLVVEKKEEEREKMREGNKEGRKKENYTRKILTEK